mmetsp:Transcript_23471/g.61710  ORF Transcript_23471/g.61710 Transcript_23471/m.61710 type:complete len:219 (+) Transcript_23471:1081-1737(+)
MSRCSRVPLELWMPESCLEPRPPAGPDRHHASLRHCLTLRTVPTLLSLRTLARKSFHRNASRTATRPASPGCRIPPSLPICMWRRPSSLCPLHLVLGSLPSTMPRSFGLVCPRHERLRRKKWRPPPWRPRCVGAQALSFRRFFRMSLVLLFRSTLGNTFFRQCQMQLLRRLRASHQRPRKNLFLMRFRCPLQWTVMSILLLLGFRWMCETSSDSLLTW